MGVEDVRRQLFGLLLLGLFLASGALPLPGANVTIHQDGISFSDPENLIDITPYDFREDQRRELVMVSHGTLPSGIDTVEGLMIDRRKEYEFKSGTELNKVEERNVLILGLKARRLQFAIDSEPGVVGCWIVVILDKANYMQVSYAGHDGATSAARADHIFGSIRRAGNWPLGAPGFTRRHAGSITLDVPAALHAPHVFQFVSFGEKTRVEIKLPEGSGPPATLEVEVAADASVGTIRDQRKQSLGSSGRESMISYELTRNEPNSAPQIVQRIQLVKGSKIIQISGKAPVPEASQLEALLSRLRLSVQSDN